MTVGNVIVVAAGRTGGNAAVRLVSVDPATLAVQQQGKDNIVAFQLPRVLGELRLRGLDSGHGAFLGRFDQSLDAAGAVGACRGPVHVHHRFRDRGFRPG